MGCRFGDGIQALRCRRHQAVYVPPGTEQRYGFPDGAADDRRGGQPRPGLLVAPFKHFTTPQIDTTRVTVGGSTFTPGNKGKGKGGAGLGGSNGGGTACKNEGDPGELGHH